MGDKTIRAKLIGGVLPMMWATIPQAGWAAAAQQDPVQTATPPSAAESPDQVPTGNRNVAISAQASTDSDRNGAGEIIVTGSRITAPNLTSTSPIQVISSKEIEISGRTDLPDLLYRLPQITNDSSTSSVAGIATANLRGLGPKRTLVLVNGRRLGIGDATTGNASSAADLQQVPSELVERVDVVTGGASAAYGSDAVAGVVNFVLKRNFSGVQVAGQLGENWHNNGNSYVQGLVQDFGATAPSGSRKDGRNGFVSAIFGANLPDNAGNITAYFRYFKADTVLSGNRDFGFCQLEANDDLDGAQCTGSSNSNRFTPNPLTSNQRFAVVGNQLLRFPAAGQFPAATYSSQPLIDITRGDERFVGTLLGHLDLDDHAKPYFEFGFMSDRSNLETSPSGLFQDSNPNDPISSNYNINCNNPLLSGQQRGVLCSAGQIAAANATPNQPCTVTQGPDGPVLSPNCVNVRIGRRNLEGGNRLFEFEHTNYRVVIGMTGKIIPGWSYDLYGQYYRSDVSTSQNNYFSYDRIDKALQVTGTAANPVCISGPPCVPYNIFTTGAVTQAQLDYLYIDGSTRGAATQKILHVDVNGDLGQYGLKLPWADDGVRVAFGFERRIDGVDYRPDSAQLSGQLAGGSAVTPINRSISVNDYFAEVRVPLVSNTSWAQELAVNAGFRHSDYSTSGSVNTGKFEAQYAPFQGLRFRGSYQRAIRAPDVFELFTPSQLGSITFGSDPCAPPITATFEQCARTGVTRAQYDGQTIPQGTGSLLTQLTGGNAQLKPEISDSLTFGATVSPAALRSLSLSVDYYDIRLKNAIGPLSATIAVQQCLAGGDPLYCGQIVRSRTNGGLTSGSVAAGGYISQTNVNIGARRLRGIDVQASYRLEAGGLGAITFDFAGSYLLRDVTKPTPVSDSYDCAGLFGATCGIRPKWRHTARTTWSTPWHIDASVAWRFVGAASLDSNSDDPTLHFSTFGDFNTFNARIKGQSYFDLALVANVTKDFRIRVGANNIFDKDPPLITSENIGDSQANTLYLYDTVGRQVFVGATLKF